MQSSFKLTTDNLGGHFSPFEKGPCRPRLKYPILPSSHPCFAAYSQDGVDHVQAHLDAVPGVVVVGLGQARDAVVAVPKDLDAQAIVVLKAER